MNKRIWLLFFIIFLGLILIGLGGYTYSYLRKGSSQYSTNEITTFACLSITFQSVNGSTPINLTNAYPISDSEGLETTPYSFTITNTCNNAVAVSVNLESLDVESKIDPSHIKVAIDSPSHLNPIGLLLTSYPSATATITDATSNTLDKITLDGLESKTYSLRLWIDEATTKNEAFNMTYQGKVVAVSSPTKIYIENVSYNNLDSDSLLYYIKTGNYTYSAPLTTPGRAISGSSEAIISTSFDDYGNSYYFRGAVNNNFVVFAGMCWRIVRITGDGAIKLVLANYSGTDCSQTGNTLAFARVNGTSYKSAFNSSNSYNAYVGYMYGTPNSSTYAAEQANVNDSTILARLKTWYDAKFTSVQQDLLADVIWCNDKSTSDAGYGTGNSSYSGRTRLYSSSSAAPSLICPLDKLSGKLSKFTAQDTDLGNGMLHDEENGNYLYYKIGLMTADEVAFAGGVWSTANSSFYLKRNTNADNWWTMTPLNRQYTIQLVNGNGALHSYQSEATKSNSVRPSIALVPDVTVALQGTGEPGSATNPYVVVESLNGS